MFSSSTRVGLVVVAAAGLLGLTACGDGGGDGATVTTVNIRPSSYEVKSPATTTTIPIVPAAGADGRSAAEQTYIVQSDNDVPFNIARKFDVDLDELRNYNGWEDGTYAGFPGTGGTVRIPPGALFIDPNATTTTAAGSTEGDAGDDQTTASPGSCTAGTHELEEGDYPVDVARKYDVTVDALLAANGWSMDASGNVAQWPAAGSTVNIPAGSNCSTTTTAAAVTG